MCGECGTLIAGVHGNKMGKGELCGGVCRLDYGKKYCKNSPTIDEGPLQRSILAAINSVMSDKDKLIRQITDEIKAEAIPGETMTIADIKRRMEEINEKTREIVMNTVSAENEMNSASQLKAMLDEMAYLKEKKADIEEQHRDNAMAIQRIEDNIAIMEQAPAELTEWDEPMVRKLADMVKVISKEKIIVYLRGGTEVEQDMAE